MNEDKGLKKAIKEQPQFRLSSNFTYLTMQKVEQGMRLRERKVDLRTLWATIAASLFLIGGCIAGAYIFYGDSLKIYVAARFASPSAFEFSPLYIIITAIPVFVLFDCWMRKQYFKRHS